MPVNIEACEKCEGKGEKIIEKNMKYLFALITKASGRELWFKDDSSISISWDSRGWFCFSDWQVRARKTK